ncbi:MAG: DUF3833 domain-containing protein [Halioglobus sp.]
MTKLPLLLLLTLLLGACSSVSVDDHANFRPALDPVLFFDGKLTAHGVIKNRGGRVIRTFSADIVASWQNGVGTLDEAFVFDDGEVQQRVWTLTPSGDGTYLSTAGDVVGEGLLTTAGNSIFLDYVLRIAYGESSIDVKVDDRMYLVSENVLINESIMKKFGVRVGSIALVIIRHESSTPAS